MTHLTPAPDSDVSPATGVSALRAGAVSRAAPAPEVLRCGNTADFLAALPALAGFTAENSIFLVCFQGNRGGNVIRIDLPDSDDPRSTESFHDLIISLMRQTGAGAERPAAVLTTTLGFAETGAVPRGRLAHQLKRRFHREGWSFRELAVIASDGWCGLLSDSSGRPRPLSEIEQSPIAARTRGRERAAVSLASLGSLPEPHPDRRLAVGAWLHELQQRRLASSAHPASNMPRTDRTLLRIRQAARVADACFAPPAQLGTAAANASPRRFSTAEDRQSTHVPDRLLAKLIDTVQQQTGWLVCVLTALTRAEFVVDVAHATGADRLADILIESEPEAKLGTREGWSIRHLLTSLAHEMPPKEKLRAVIAVAEDALVHAPETLRPPLFAMLAWAWWAIGMQSVATRIAAEGLKSHPDHELLRMVQQLCDTPPAAHLSGLREKLAHAA